MQCKYWSKKDSCNFGDFHCCGSPILTVSEHTPFVCNVKIDQRKILAILVTFVVVVPEL